MVAEEMKQNWLAQTFRLTLFTSEPEPGGGTLWHQLTHKDPESDENRPRERARRQVGSYENGQLSITAAPGRVDIVLDQLANSPSVWLGPLEAELTTYLELVRPWLAKIDWKITRFAFAGILLLPAKDKVDGYNLFCQFVPSVKIDPERTRDLLFQINWPRQSKQGVELNHIDHWSVAVVTAMNATNPKAALTLFEHHFLRLAFDYNTPAERSEPLEKGSILPIFDELVGLAMETTSQGEATQ